MRVSIVKVFKGPYQKIDRRLFSTGTVCNIDINECASSPCQNNATCQDQLGFFTCACPAGIIGNLCETNIDDCEVTYLSSKNLLVANFTL